MIADVDGVSMAHGCSCWRLSSVAGPRQGRSRYVAAGPSNHHTKAAGVKMARNAEDVHARRKPSPGIDTTAKAASSRRTKTTAPAAAVNSDQQQQYHEDLVESPSPRRRITDRRHRRNFVRRKQSPSVNDQTAYAMVTTHYRR